jgi:hypothetical protein
MVLPVSFARPPVWVALNLFQNLVARWGIAPPVRVTLNLFQGLVARWGVMMVL